MAHDEIKKEAIEAVKQLADKRTDRASMLGITPRRLRKIENGDVPTVVLRWIAAGVLRFSNSEETTDAN